MAMARSGMYALFWYEEPLPVGTVWGAFRHKVKVQNAQPCWHPHCKGHGRQTAFNELNMSVKNRLDLIVVSDHRQAIRRLSGCLCWHRQPPRLTMPDGVSGSVSQILIAQIGEAILGEQSLGREAVYDFWMVAIFKGREVGFKCHVGLQFGEIEGLFKCHFVILSVDRRWTDREKDRRL